MASSKSSSTSSSTPDTWPASAPGWGAASSACGAAGAAAAARPDLAASALPGGARLQRLCLALEGPLPAPPVPAQTQRQVKGQGWCWLPPRRAHVGVQADPLIATLPQHHVAPAVSASPPALLPRPAPREPLLAPLRGRLRGAPLPGQPLQALQGAWQRLPVRRPRQGRLLLRLQVPLPPHSSQWRLHGLCLPLPPSLPLLQQPARPVWEPCARWRRPPGWSAARAPDQAMTPRPAHPAPAES